jgi:hypothetical protein
MSLIAGGLISALATVVAALLARARAVPVRGYLRRGAAAVPPDPQTADGAAAA